jgi:hypothetical protein
VTEKKEEPVTLNAFELISMSEGLNLGNLFDSEQVWGVADSSFATLNIKTSLCGCLNIIMIFKILP